MKVKFLLAAFAAVIVSNVFAKTPNCNESAAAGVNWSRCNKAESDLTKADLRAATLVETNFTKAKLREADLRGAVLYKADLTGSSLVGAKLRSAILKEAKLNFIRQAYKADFSWANLDGAELNGTSLEQVNMSDASLVKAKSFRTVLTDANFTRANLTDADFLQSFGDRSDFKHAILINTNFYRYNTWNEPSDFHNANLTNAKFTAGLFMAGANFTDANLTNAKFIGAFLNKVNLTGANVTNADFSGASINGTICKPGSIGSCMASWEVNGSACVGMDRNLHCIITDALSPNEPKKNFMLSIIEKGEYICEIELTGEYKPDTSFKVEQNDILNIKPSLQWQLNATNPSFKMEVDSRNAAIGAALIVIFQSNSDKLHHLKFDCVPKEPGLAGYATVRTN